MTGIDPSTVVGFIHSHPGSGPYPSGPDRDGFAQWRSWLNEFANGSGDTLRYYVVGTRRENGQTALEIRAYGNSNIETGNAENPGPEVNPDAEPCPNV